MSFGPGLNLSSGKNATMMVPSHYHTATKLAEWNSSLMNSIEYGTITMTFFSPKKFHMGHEK